MIQNGIRCLMQVLLVNHFDFQNTTARRNQLLDFANPLVDRNDRMDFHPSADSLGQGIILFYDRPDRFALILRQQQMCNLHTLSPFYGCAPFRQNSGCPDRKDSRFYHIVIWEGSFPGLEGPASLSLQFSFGD